MSAGVPYDAADQVIEAAGPAARAAWEAFTSDNRIGSDTRFTYTAAARTFFRWLDARGLGLADAHPQTIHDYLHRPEVRASTRGVYRSALRRLFAALLDHGVIAAHPLGEGRRDTKPQRPPTRDELKRYVHELALEPIEEGTEEFDAALLLLAALQCGTRRVLPVARVAGIAPRWAAECAARLRESGVWTSGGKTACEWFEEEEHGALAFWLDVWTAEGMLERRFDAGPEVIALPDRSGR